MSLIETVAMMGAVVWLVITGYITSVPHPQDMIDRAIKVYLVLWFLVMWPVLLVRKIREKFWEVI